MEKPKFQDKDLSSDLSKDLGISDNPNSLRSRLMKDFPMPIPKEKDKDKK